MQPAQKKMNVYYYWVCTSDGTYVGILERSALMEQFQDHPVLHYKLFLLGKSGIGKTSTVNKLCGRSNIHICNFVPVHVHILMNAIYF